MLKILEGRTLAPPSLPITTHIEESQEWDVHFKKLTTSLNQRLWVIRRIMRQIPREKLVGIVHSLWISKLRYGLQLCTRVKITNQDPTSGNMKALQITQNRMLRLLNGSRIKDKISIKFMPDKFGYSQSISWLQK